MRPLSSILILGFMILLVSKKSHATETNPHYFVTEELLPSSEEYTRLLNHPVLSDILEIKNVERPTKCPLKSVSGVELFQKLHLISKTFQYGKCLKNPNNPITELSNLANSLFTTYASVTSSTTDFSSLTSLSTITDVSTSGGWTNLNAALKGLETSDQNPQDSTYYTNALIYLNTISNDPNCIENLKKKGFLSTLGTILTTMGQASLIFPSTSGFIYSAAGIGLGTTLKILGSLFQSTFDWNDPEERKQFQDLNCSFYEMRSDIDAARIFNINEKVSLEKIAEISKQLALIETYKNKLLEEQKKVSAEILKRKKKYYELKNVLIDYELTEIMISYLGTIEPELEKAQGDQALMIRVTSDFSKTLSSSPGFESLKDTIIIKKIFSFFVDDLVMEMHGSEYAILTRKFIRPLVTYIKNEKSLLDLKLVTPTKDFLALSKTHDENTNQTMIKKIDTAYLELLKKVGDSIVFFQNQVKILTDHHSHEELSSTDDSSHTHYDSIEEYLKIQSLIYSNYGYPYTKHFRTNAYAYYKIFEEKREKFQFYAKKIPQKKELPWVCRTAKQAAVTWEFADDSIEVLWDFFETNKGLFYQDVRRVEIKIGFIAAGKSKAYKLYKSARSAEIAKNILIKNENLFYQRSELNDYGLTKRHNIGKLMLKIKEAKSDKEIITKFMKENKCNRYL